MIPPESKANCESRVRLRPDVAGESPTSVWARATLRPLYDDHTPCRPSVEVVDILETPLRRLAEGILFSPTLMKLSPPSNIRFVGDLNDTAHIFEALGLKGARS